MPATRGGPLSARCPHCHRHLVHGDGRPPRVTGGMKIKQTRHGPVASREYVCGNCGRTAWSTHEDVARVARGAA